jgi:excisionase family DNA binding protein
MSNNSLIEWITTAEAAELTGYNLEYIRQMIRRRVIVAEKKGRDWWVDRCAGYLVRPFGFLTGES